MRQNKSWLGKKLSGSGINSNGLPVVQLHLKAPPPHPPTPPNQKKKRTKKDALRGQGHETGTETRPSKKFLKEKLGMTD